MEPKYLPSHITPEAHLDNFDKSRYEVRSGGQTGVTQGAGRADIREVETLYLTGNNTR